MKEEPRLSDPLQEREGDEMVEVSINQEDY